MSITTEFARKFAAQVKVFGENVVVTTSVGPIEIAGIIFRSASQEQRAPGNLTALQFAVSDLPVAIRPKLDTVTVRDVTYQVERVDADEVDGTAKALLRKQ